MNFQSEFILSDAGVPQRRANTGISEFFATWEQQELKCNGNIEISATFCVELVRMLLPVYTYGNYQASL